jgi:hypothetical protein
MTLTLALGARVRRRIFTRSKKRHFGRFFLPMK